MILVQIWNNYILDQSYLSMINFCSKTNKCKLKNQKKKKL